jgi:hypothetical protein
MNGSSPTDDDLPSDRRLRELRGLLEAARELVNAELKDLDHVAAEDDRLATEYERTAALYRRRAARRPDEAERFTKKAQWFEQRARIKRSGLPMPRELQTPSETLSVVDDLRRALVHFLQLANGLNTGDLRAFAACLIDRRVDPVADGALEAFLGAASALVVQLGAVHGMGGCLELHAYSAPLVVAPDAEPGAVSADQR